MFRSTQIQRSTIAMFGPDSAGRAKLFAALPAIPGTSRVAVNDGGRLEALAAKAQAKRTVPATIETRLISDLKGERSSAKAWVMVVAHEAGMDNYRKFVREISDLDAELLSSRMHKTSGKIRKELESALLALEKDTRIDNSWDDPEICRLTQDLVSLRPWLVVENFSERKSADPSKLNQQGREYLAMNVDMELELLGMAQDDDFRNEYLKSCGFDKSVLPEVVRKFPALAGLGIFYTVGEIEARAWLYSKTVKIVDASAAIHSDFPKKFLHADVIKVTDYLRQGRQTRCSQKGREYELQDGEDIVDFKLKK